MYKNADGQYVINVDVNGGECEELNFPEEEYINFEEAYKNLQSSKQFQNSYHICLYHSGKSIGFCLFGLYSLLGEDPEFEHFQTIVNYVFLKPNYRNCRYSELMANEVADIIYEYSRRSECTDYEDVSQLLTANGERFVDNIEYLLENRGIHRIS